MHIATWMIKGSSIPAEEGAENLSHVSTREHSGQNVSKVLTLFLAGIEEPFTIHATASWEAPASLSYLLSSSPPMP